MAKKRGQFPNRDSKSGKANTTSLRGREAGTSSRSKSGKPIGSKAHRAKQPGCLEPGDCSK